MYRSWCRWQNIPEQCEQKALCLGTSRSQSRPLDFAFVLPSSLTEPSVAVIVVSHSAIRHVRQSHTSGRKIHLGSIEVLLMADIHTSDPDIENRNPQKTRTFIFRKTVKLALLHSPKKPLYNPYNPYKARPK